MTISLWVFAIVIGIRGDKDKFADEGFEPCAKSGRKGRQCAPYSLATTPERHQPVPTVIAIVFCFVV